MKQIERVRVKHITEERNPLTVGLESMSTEGRKDQLMFRGRVCRPWLGNKWAWTGESPAWWTERGYGGERGKWGEGWDWFPVRGTRADIRLSSGKVCCFSFKELAILKKCQLHLLLILIKTHGLFFNSHHWLFFHSLLQVLQVFTPSTENKWLDA